MEGGQTKRRSFISYVLHLTSHYLSHDRTSHKEMEHRIWNPNIFVLPEASRECLRFPMRRDGNGDSSRGRRRTLLLKLGQSSILFRYIELTMIFRAASAARARATFAGRRLSSSSLAKTSSTSSLNAFASGWYNLYVDMVAFMTAPW